MQPILPARWLIAPSDAVDDPTVYPAVIGAGFLALKTPSWSTSVATSSSGRERRQQRWSYPRWLFTIPYEVLRDRADTPDIQRLWSFFNSQGGQAGEFKLRDTTDYLVTNGPIGTGDGSTTTFQMQRTMAVGAIGFAEPVLAISGAPAVYVNGALTTAFTIGAYGQITFAAPPAAGAKITWTGQFFFVVRFTVDLLDTAQVMAGAWSSGGVTMMSIKP